MNINNRYSILINSDLKCPYCNITLPKPEHFSDKNKLCENCNIRYWMLFTRAYKSLVIYARTYTDELEFRTRKVSFIKW